MPLISITPKKNVELLHNTILELQQKCESCDLLREKTVKEIFTYAVSNDYVTDDGPAMVAIASYDNNIYAIHAPEYLTDKQFVVFEFLLCNIEPQDEIIVFSQSAYIAVKKYTNGKVKPYNIYLCV